MGKKLYGHVSKDNLQYEWKSEPGACKVCQAMDGTIYESANDIPDRPHPNCKCHIEIIEKENTKSSDPLNNLIQKKKDKENTLFDTNEIIGHTKSLLQELDEYNKKINEQECIIKEFENIFDINKFEEKDKLLFFNAKEKLQFAKYRGENTKQQLIKLQNDSIILKGGIEKTNILSFVYAIFQTTLALLFKTLYSLVNTVIELTKNLIKIIPDLQKNVLARLYVKYAADKYGQYHSQKYDMPEAYNLYKIGSESYNYNIDYIKQNGTLYNSINELHNYKQELDIKNRLKLEEDFPFDDCRVVKLRSNSDIAKKIEDSNALKNFIFDNITELTQNNRLAQNKEIIFQNDDADLYSTLHSVAAKNVFLDKEYNIHLNIEDLWNFNPDRPSVKGKLGKYLQDNGALSPFYIIIDIIIPKYKWQNYKI